MSDFLAVLQKGLAELKMDFTPKQLDQCQRYLELLLDWNKRINLTAITDSREIAVKHFLDALAGGRYIHWHVPGDILDLGAGAGFPGLVLKIWQRERQFLLVDAVQKKVNFMALVMEKLELEGIQALHSRAEALGRQEEHREHYGIVVARAVAGLPVLAEYCLPLVRVGGYFYAFKGPSFQAELAQAEEALGILGGQVEEVYSYPLPISGDARSLIAVKKINPTPAPYPRRSGLPEKRPLGPR
ncbi:MAG TPA: 16S rRNA (guanine(527)-N(7))-methyltransferase RsmG [Clostridia bacterium]|nr:16S rRNA (guanine(527)-N(7))-methyltransferase RsmG [Clostridia bacterium]